MLRDETLSYYDAVAPEYESAYAGKGPAISGLSDHYARDIDNITRLLARFGQGHLLDLACGTAYWLPHYAPNCRQITLVDQSPTMLARSRETVARLDVRQPVTYIEGNVLDYPFAPSAYDCAVVGFLLSHLTTAQEQRFFDTLRTALKRAATLMVFDSVWSEVRKPHRIKEGYERRTLSDGRSFGVYKRNFEPAEFEAMLTTGGFEITEQYAGDLFIAAVARSA
jgi:demethylmenaquinone methyltransferase/2-methoxy-6-polyprenyl-1,4-benzoquinol methylase